MKAILATTDLSPRSLTGVERALMLAHAQGATCTIVHALPLDNLAPLRELLGVDVARVTQQLTDDARASLQAMIQDIAEREGVSPSLLLDPRTVVPAIVEAADTRNVDLILLGAHGEGFVQELLFGTTASRVIRAAHRPVLAVKQPPKGPYRRVLVTADFSPASGESLRLVRAVAPDADLILLNVFELPFESRLHHAGVSREDLLRYQADEKERVRERLHELAARNGLLPDTYTALAVHGDASREILRHELDRDCDLIVVGKHGRHFTEELLLGSVTKHLLAQSRGDVLVVADRGRPGAGA